MSWPSRRPPRILRGRPTSLGATLPASIPSAGRRAAVRGPALPVAVRRCYSYRPEQVAAALAGMLDDLGGLASLVAGKTVAVKVNLTGRSGTPCLSRPATQTYRCHPSVVLGLAALLDRAGARRIAFLDGLSSTLSLREFAGLDGWDLASLDSLGARLDFVNTRNRGAARHYKHLSVPGGGSLFPSYWVHPAYGDCDVFVSLAKLKIHATAGVTLTAKNLFGMTPPALYGGGEVDEDYVGPRLLLHYSRYRPPAGLPRQVPSATHCDEPGRVARHIVDALAMRPVHLAIIDGITSISGGAGPWDSGLEFVRPGLLIAGRNSVSTDAVATACMGYNPAAATGTSPFPGENHLRLAADAGLGSIDLERIEMRGLPLGTARHDFGWVPERPVTAR